MICFRCFEPLYFRNKGSADTFINADPIRTGHIGQYPQAYNLKSGRGRLAQQYSLVYLCVIYQWWHWIYDVWLSVCRSFLENFLMLPRMVDNLSCPNASFSFRCVFEPVWNLLLWVIFYWLHKNLYYMLDRYGFNLCISDKKHLAKAGTERFGKYSQDKHIIQFYT